MVTTALSMDPALAGCWLLFTGCWLLGMDYWFRLAYWLFGYWSLALQIISYSIECITHYVQLDETWYNTRPLFFLGLPLGQPLKLKSCAPWCHQSCGAVKTTPRASVKSFKTFANCGKVWTACHSFRYCWTRELLLVKWINFICGTKNCAARKFPCLSSINTATSGQCSGQLLSGQQCLKYSSLPPLQMA